MTHDDVLLESKELINFAQGGRIGKDARRVLEGRRRDEALRLKRGLGDTKQHRGRFSRFSTLSLNLTVLIFKGRPIHLLAP